MRSGNWTADSRLAPPADEIDERKRRNGLDGWLCMTWICGIWSRIWVWFWCCCWGLVAPCCGLVFITLVAWLYELIDPECWLFTDERFVLLPFPLPLIGCCCCTALELLLLLVRCFVVAGGFSDSSSTCEDEFLKIYIVLIGNRKSSFILVYFYCLFVSMIPSKTFKRRSYSSRRSKSKNYRLSNGW